LKPDSPEAENPASSCLQGTVAANSPGGTSTTGHTGGEMQKEKRNKEVEKSEKRHPQSDGGNRRGRFPKFFK
jgi:hypothetical protein